MKVARDANVRDRGSAIVDFVLILLVLLPLVIAIAQLAIVLHTRNTLASAASEGARYAAVAGSSPEAGRAKTNELIDGALSAKFKRVVSVHPDVVGGAAGIKVVVESDVLILGIGGPGMHLVVSGRAISEQQ